ncbi:putative beta-galactosidase protein [Phaeoacremonium minimum UCRPA7]|uniref:beta-galactosidase n=1 Tax=Phaeoacremonium minimum (strain UCR-PA7) TaxID=1286976 RepID=R8BCW2_PHAM7|nr:putative beta-galactosidase protein [Phaeoacremonium minimum UCRPA7]EON97131.1 putative beta-galactosidase protein [Phaeoacremonium minimum UCRPA7]
MPQTMILFQPENEYCAAVDPYPFPDYDYWDYVVDHFREPGIVVPSVNNEAWPLGAITPTTPAKVDIYGHDSYPLGLAAVTSGDLTKHTIYAPRKFERVLYKNVYAAGATIFNIYMTYGGTNWGNLGHSDGYTSYDYGAQIAEDRSLTREKYSESKLQANFFHVSPAFLETDRWNASLEWTDTGLITVTPATTNTTKFYIARHTTYDSLDTTKYRLKVQTVQFGNLTVPQIGDSLSLTRRDSKIHVSDYAVGNKNLVYSTAEIFTWKQYEDRTVLVVYGGPDEYHEIALKGEASNDNDVIEGSNVKVTTKTGLTILGWTVSAERTVVRVQKDLYIYFLIRNEAYKYWVPATPSDYGTSDVIVKAGYLVRTAEVNGGTLSLVGDVNATTPVEVIGGAPANLKSLLFNGKPLSFKQDKVGVVTATVDFKKPTIKIPCLSSLKWKYIDSLPEIQPEYSDEAWTAADLEKTFNTHRPLDTPTSLYGGDYGYHAGSLVYRGHFTSNGEETEFNITTQGGNAYGTSVWLNDQFIGSWVGNAITSAFNSTFVLPKLKAGRENVFTVVVEHMGLNGNWVVGAEEQKNPRGILNYELAGHPKSDISWKITGNLGGEDYQDKSRGPLNEGGLFIERQGYHLPAPPSATWEDSKGPTAGITKPGIAYYATSFDLNLPTGYDIPLSFTFSNTTLSAYRAQLFVNGYQFGKFVHHVGPQTRFPVPEGILNYHGTNYLGLTLWAMEEGGAKLEGFKLEVGVVSTTGFGDVQLSPMPKWEKRDDAY